MGDSSTTLTEAITTVRDFLDEPVPQMWSDAQITRYLNIGQIDVQRQTETLRELMTVPVTANVQKYTAPADLMRIYRLEYVPTGSQQTYGLEFRGYNEMDTIWGTYQQYTGAFPSMYTLWKNPPNMQIVAYPVPSQDGNFNCFYYRQTVDVVAGSDTLDCLPGYESVIFDFAVYRALRQDADPRWQDQYQLYTENVTKLVDMSRTFSDQANFISTGTSNVPAWLVNGSY